MSRMLRAIASGALLATALGAAAQAQRPLFETTKVEGTDNVYVFRYGNRQSMFIVTPAGVIATDPIAYGFPETVPTYLKEIRKVTDRPIKYLIYSHHHFDHILAASRSRMPARRSSPIRGSRNGLRSSRIRRLRYPMRSSPTRKRSSLAAPPSS